MAYQMAPSATGGEGPASIPPLGTCSEDVVNLPPELARVAQEELGETAVGRTAALAELRALMAATRDMTFPREDDSHLLRFLRAKKYRLEDAYKTLKNYTRFLAENGDPNTIKAADVRPLYDAGFMQILPGATRSGCRISTLLPSKLKKTKEMIQGDAMLKWNVYAMDKLLDDPYMQVNGYVIVENFAGFSLYDAFAMNSMMDAKTSKKMFSLLQDTMPVRLKGIWVINQPWYISMVWAVVRPFMKQKLRDRVKFFGPNVRGLYDLVDRAQLPPEFGGSLAESESWLDRQEAREAIG